MEHKQEYIYTFASIKILSGVMEPDTDGAEIAINEKREAMTAQGWELAHKKSAPEGMLFLVFRKPALSAPIVIR